MLKHIIYLPYFVCFCALAGCNTGYQEIDGQWCFVTWNEGQGRRATKLEVDEAFRVLENEDFAKDSENVFFKGSIIENADAPTFETLGDDGYAKDKNRVFLFEFKIPFANPATFEVLEYPYSKDDLRVFCGTVPMNVGNVDEFEVLQTSSMIHTTSAKYLGRKIPGLSLPNDMTVVIGSGKGRTRTQSFVGPYEHKKGDNDISVWE